MAGPRELLGRDTFDVIVVGGGGSGLASAVSAAENGLTVVVLERLPQLGGTTGIAVGSFTAAGTRWQQAAGIEDSIDAHAVDAGKFADPEIEQRNHHDLRRYFLSEAAPTLDWLQSMRLTFVGPHPEPPNRAARMHNVVPGAKAYIAALQLRLRRLRVPVACEADVDELVMETGAVRGVRVRLPSGEFRLKARRGVVLAGGDYAANRDLIARFKGDEYRAVDGINPHATGHGHLLAMQAEAQMLNMDVTYGPELRFVPPARRPFQQCLPVSGWRAAVLGQIARRLPDSVMRWWVRRLLVTWQHPEDSLFADGAILLNQQGRRFVDECQWPAREIAVASQAAKSAYILLDQKLCERYAAWPHFISTAPDIAYAYVQDYARLRPDVTTTGPDLATIAQRRGLPADAVRDTVEQYNRSLRDGSDDAFGRTDRRQLLEGSYWALLGPVRAYFTTTEGGAAINRRLQVLNGDGEVIPGLYAVGQVGLGGMILWGHGLHIGWAMTSGRLVGRELAQVSVSPE